MNTFKKLLLAFSLALLFSPLAHAQNFTTVTATITDTNGIPYSYASISAQILPAGTSPTVNGQGISGFTQANADVNGKFSMLLASNAVIVPGGTQWQFTVNEAGILPPFGTGAQSFVAAITISGTTQNISTTLNALSPKLTNFVGSGTVGSGLQYALAEYLSATTIGSGPTPPTGNGMYNCGYNVTASVAVPLSCPQVGLTARSISGATTTDTVTFTDVASGAIDHDQAASGAVTETLPTGITLGNSTAVFKYTNHSSQADTITPTTWTIQAGNSAPGGTLSVPSGYAAVIWVDPHSSTNWLADVTPATFGVSGIVSGTAGQCPYFSATNTVAGGTVCIDMAGVSGADLGAKMVNCQAALPATGGTCKGDNLPAAQTLSTAVTTSKAVVFTFCGQQVSQSANATLAATKSSIYGCPGRNSVFTKAGNIDQLTMSGSGNVIDGITLVGVSGTYTGKGIDASSSSSGVIRNTNISGEAGTAIAGGSAYVGPNNTLLGGTTGNPVVTSLGGIVTGNIITANAADAVDLGNQTLAHGNSVGLNPNASTSGLCAFNIAGDVLLAVVAHNSVALSDSNSGNVNYGYCMTPSVGSGHMFANVMDANTFDTVMSGGAQGIGFYWNNTNNLTTEAKNNRWVNNSCIHETQCLLRTDGSIPDTNYYSEFSFNNGGFSGTGGTKDVVEQTINPVTCATMPIAGNGSRVAATNCAPGQFFATGSSPNVYTNVNGTWIGQHNPNWTFVQSTSKEQAGASATLAFTNRNIPGDFVAVGVFCQTGGGAPTLAVTDTSNSYTSASTIEGVPTNTTWWEQTFYAPAVVGGANSVTVSSSVNACLYIELTIAEYQQVAQIAPQDGTSVQAQGTSASLASGNATVNLGDLVIGFGINTGGGLCVGQGVGFMPRSCPGSGDSLLEDMFNTTATVNATFSGNSGNWASTVVAFKTLP